MYHINEIRKANIHLAAEKQHASEATFTVLRHGGVLLRSGNQTLTLDGINAADFINSVRDKGAGYVKQQVKKQFELALA